MSQQALISWIYYLNFIFSELILLHQLGTEAQGFVHHESHVVSISVIGNHTIVAGEDNSGTVTSLVRNTASLVGAAHQNGVTYIVFLVVVDENLVRTSCISNCLSWVEDILCVSVTAFQLNLCTWSHNMEFLC